MPKGCKLDKQSIKELWDNGYSTQEIADALGCLRDSVTLNLCKLGIRQRNRMPLSDIEREKIVKGYQSGLPASRLAKEIGREFKRVYRYLHSVGIPSRSLSDSKRKYPLDQDVFQNSERNPIAAYWVGFLMADGCVRVSKGGQKTVSLALSQRDEEHVATFQRFLNTTMPIRVVKNNRGYIGGKPLVQLLVTSARMTKDLARYGVVPRKSVSATVSILNQSRDFWRGMIDGDGWITLRNGNYPIIGLTGSLPLMKQFQAYIKDNFGKESSIRTNNSIWKVSVAGTVASRLASILYKEGDQVLTRKKFAWEFASSWKSKKGGVLSQ